MFFLSPELTGSNEWNWMVSHWMNFWFIYQSIEPWLPRPIVTNKKKHEERNIKNKQAWSEASQLASQPKPHTVMDKKVYTHTLMHIDTLGLNEKKKNHFYAVCALCVVITVSCIGIFNRPSCVLLCVATTLFIIIFVMALYFSTYARARAHSLSALIFSSFALTFFQCLSIAVRDTFFCVIRKVNELYYF